VSEPCHLLVVSFGKELLHKLAAKGEVCKIGTYFVSFTHQIVFLPFSSAVYNSICLLNVCYDISVKSSLVIINVGSVSNELGLCYSSCSSKGSILCVILWSVSSTSFVIYRLYLFSCTIISRSALCFFDVNLFAHSIPYVWYHNTVVCLI
jgi:hypothetical protein